MDEADETVAVRRMGHLTLELLSGDRRLMYGTVPGNVARMHITDWPMRIEPPYTLAATWVEGELVPTKASEVARRAVAEERARIVALLRRAADGDSSKEALRIFANDLEAESSGGDK